MKKLLNLQDKILKKVPNLKIVYNFDTKKLSTIKLGTVVRCLFYPKNVYELRALIKLLIKEKIKYLIIGNLSNTIIINNDFYLISLKEMKKKIIVKDRIISLSTNHNSSEISFLFSKRNCRTFLCLTKIPGTLGGALIMNSSVCNYNISDNLINVTFINEKGKIKTLKKEKIMFEYRHSSLMNKNYVLLEASFKYLKDNDSVRKYNEIISKRSNQPKGFSLGSVYKNGYFYYAGKLIESSGLKGFEYKGLRISNSHANIIINENGNLNDFLELLFIIELKVLLKYNIRLVREILII